MLDFLDDGKLIRSPVVGNLFYPEDPAEAEARLYAYGLEPGKGGTAKALIAPHGAWGLSGLIAAEAFHAAAGRPAGGVKRVLVMGPIHWQEQEGVYLTGSDAFDTPTGPLEVDKEMIRYLAEVSPYFTINDIPHLREHSIEVLLPLVKYCFPEAFIVPVLVSGKSEELIRALAGTLGKAFGPIWDDSLCVVSCNVAENNDPVRAEAQSQECLRLLKESDAEPFIAALRNEAISPCGGVPAAGLLASGLVNGGRSTIGAKTASGLSARGEDKVVFYGAVSWE